MYTTANKPSADDVGALVGVTKTTPLRNTTNGQWQVLARVRMPQSASTSKFNIIGGSGFNVGQHGQATESTIIIRSGNNNPKGVTAVLYNQGGFSPIIT